MTTATPDLDIRHPYRKPTDTEHHAVRGPLGQIICYPTASLREQAEKTWNSIAAQHERVTCPVADVAAPDPHDVRAYSCRLGTFIACTCGWSGPIRPDTDHAALDADMASHPQTATIAGGTR